MLFALLANLAVMYNLIVLPVLPLAVIDISGISAGNLVKLHKNQPNVMAPYRLNHTSLGMKITAQSAVIMDERSGLILWQKNPNEVRSLASISKLLAALVFLEHNPGWDAGVAINISDYQQGGRAYIYNGEIITVRDLFNLSLVASSNSAVSALARSTGLSGADFIMAMNEKAKGLGMENSNFIEPTGLAPENVSTAADIIKLARAAFAKEEIKKATIQKEYSFEVLNNGRKDIVKSTDKLLGSYLKIIAGKTGYLNEAGYCLVSQAHGQKGQSLLVAVLGSATDADRFQDLKALLEWAFDNYAWPE